MMVNRNTIQLYADLSELVAGRLLRNYAAMPEQVQLHQLPVNAIAVVQIAGGWFPLGGVSS